MPLEVCKVTDEAYRARRELSIRVMVVDDSLVVRRLVGEALSEEPRIEVAGTASSAEMALQRVPQLAPDVLILDVHMAGMSGLELLPILRERYPRVRVLLFTSSRDAACMDALVAGASDYLMKPSGMEGRAAAVQEVRTELLQKLFALCGMNAAEPERAIASRLVPPASTRVGKKAFTVPRDVLAIGSSTGGPTALATLFAGLGEDFPLPVLVVQHMPPVFTGLLAKRISARGGLPLLEAEDGMPVTAGRALLAPGDFHMRLKRVGTEVLVALDRREPECSCRPSVDVLLRSVHTAYGANAMAAVLTGMGQDGLRGAELLHREGAPVMVQDRATSVVWGMPGAIAEAGFADAVLPLHELAGAIRQQAMRR